MSIMGAGHVWRTVPECEAWPLTTRVSRPRNPNLDKTDRLQCEGCHATARMLFSRKGKSKHKFWGKRGTCSQEMTVDSLFANAFCERLYRLKDLPDLSTDMVVFSIDTYHDSGHFSLVNTILQRCDPEQCSVAAVLSLLALTRPPAFGYSYDYRDRFQQRARYALQHALGAARGSNLWSDVCLTVEEQAALPYWRKIAGQVSGKAPPLIGLVVDEESLENLRRS